MKFGKIRCLLVAGVLMISASLVAQEPAEDAPAAEPAPAKKKAAEEPEAPRDISYLPAPISAVRTNILDLKRSGYFAIDAVKFHTRQSGDEAIVWTVRCKKAITCRHAEALLRDFRDVRFYSTIEKQRLEVLATLVQYSDRLTVGSSSSRLLKQDDEFELWIDMPTTYLNKLVSMHADTLVLRRWRF